MTIPTLADRCITPSRTESRRLRSLPPWHATLVCIVFLGLIPPIALLPSALASVILPEKAVFHPLLAGLIGTCFAIGAVLGVLSMIGVSARACFLVVPTPATLAWVLIGLLLASSLVLATALASEGQLLVGDLSFWRVLIAVATGAALGLWSGTLEELVLRAGLLSVIGHQWHWPGAVVLTSGLFGLMHHGHAAEALGTVAYVLLTFLAGVFFALITLTTGNVWNAVAVHATWNAVFTEQVVAFRTPPDVTPMLSYQIETASPLVGGTVTAPTESPIAILIILLATLGMIAYAASHQPTDHR